MQGIGIGESDFKFLKSFFRATFKDNQYMEKTIEETIANAKKQIEDKKYETSLRERGFTNITKMVFAFDGKDARIEEY